MNRNIGRLEQPEPSRVIKFADGRLGAEYANIDPRTPRILRLAGRMAITDASIGGTGVAIMRMRGETQEPGKRNRIAVGNGVMFNEDTGSALVASGDTTAIPDILLGQPYAEGAVNTSSVEAVLVEVGRDRFRSAPTVTVNNVDSPLTISGRFLTVNVLNTNRNSVHVQKKYLKGFLKVLKRQEVQSTDIRQRVILKDGSLMVHTMLRWVLLYLLLISLLLVEWLRQTNIYLRIDVWACILLRQIRHLEMCVKCTIFGKFATRII